MLSLLSLVVRLVELLLIAFYSGIVLEKVAEYFYYNYKNRDAEDVQDMDVPPELCLELLMAADFLDSMFSTPWPGISRHADKVQRKISVIKRHDVRT